MYAGRHGRIAVTARGAVLAGMAVAVACAAICYALGNTYIDRLPDHHGFYLIDAPNRASGAPATRPRHAVVVLIDGLRQDAARNMGSMQALAATGRCGPTDTGNLTVSRPVYAMISSGVEADRTGVRNNDETRPAPVESLWGVARGAGLRVRGYSGLPWWRELFPAGFDDYEVVRDREIDLFAHATLADLTLIHVLYVDDAGHDAGADSTAYRAAVARADRELGGLLARLDLGRDLLVVTADHGHSAAGGHGGTAPEIARVETCWAGVGIGTGAAPPLDARTIAPALAVLLGVPFPRHLTAGDDVDLIFDLVATDAANASARRGDLEQVRAVHRARLAGWLGTEEGTWAALYQSERAAQRTRALLALGAIALLIGVSLWRRRLGWAQAAASAVWMAGLVGACAALFAAARGSFDFTAINLRSEFVRASLCICIGVGAVGAIIHLLAWRDPRRLVADLATAVATVAALGATHAVVFGWPMGFPLPAPAALFWPFFAAPLALGLAAIASLAAVVAALRP